MEFELLFRTNVHHVVDIVECLVCSHFLLEEIGLLLFLELPLNLLEERLFVHAIESESFVLLLGQRVIAAS